MQDHRAEVVALEAVLGQSFDFEKKGEQGVLVMRHQPLTERQTEHLKFAGVTVRRRGEDSRALTYLCGFQKRAIQQIPIQKGPMDSARIRSDLRR